MVRYYLKRHRESVRIWEQEVVQGCFGKSEHASAFLLRTNHFLRKEVVNGMSIVQTVVKTQSYAAFMRMPKLASLLLFEYLEVCKLEDPSAAGAAGSGDLLLHGFGTFVSSLGQGFSLAGTDVPVCCTRPTVVQGLRCLARLLATAFELMGLTTTARSLCFELETKVMAQSKDDMAKDSWEPSNEWKGECREILDKKLDSILGDVVVEGVLQSYIAQLKEQVGFFVNSASGERREIDGESVLLALFSSQSFVDMISSDAT